MLKHEGDSSKSSLAPNKISPPSSPKKTLPLPPPPAPEIDIEAIGSMPRPSPKIIPAKRIGADPSSGRIIVLSEPSTICDACPNCRDVCSSATCKECVLKKEKLKTFDRGKSSSSGYTMCQIRRHNNLASCWLIAGGIVYDATCFVKDHPGGVKSILRYAGGKKDTTDDMLFHTKETRRQWKELGIGKVKTCGECTNDGDASCVVS
jgi:hypothetical protein